jgi:hypothetical protein
MASINDNYKTSDLALATALSLNYPIFSIDKSNPTRSEFCFEKCDGIYDFVNKYWNGELRVEPQKFLPNLKLLKLVCIHSYGITK